MLIISAGMPKSGSGYVFNLLNDLQIATGYANVRDIKSKYKLEKLMRWHNCNIGALTFNVLFRLWLITLKEKSFVVKTHKPPTFAVKLFSKLGLIKIIYGYRDPRDVLLSAVDHGHKMLANGETDYFAAMVEFDDALRKVKTWLDTWQSYHKMPNVLIVKYEDWYNNPGEMLETFEKFLQISVSQETRNNILWNYSRENPDRTQPGLHFNKAVLYRYKSEMTSKQQKACQDIFAQYLENMGYS